MKSKGLRVGTCIATLWAVTSVYAEAPVVDLSQPPVSSNTTVSASTSAAQAADLHADNTTVAPTATNNVQEASVSSNLTSEQRLDRLERQMVNLTQMNLPQQVSDLQGQIDQLRGRLQVEQHDLQLLNDQQKSFYQELDQRLSHLKSAGSAAPANTAQTPATTSAANDGAQLKDSGAYQAAFTLLESKQYDQAESTFQQYLKDYPHGQYVVNAHYWLGEIYGSQKKNDQAAAEFKIVIDQFPQSVKVSDAKLKIAIIHQEAGDVVQARSEFLQIKQQYPDSTAAQLANIRLQSLNTQ